MKYKHGIVMMGLSLLALQAGAQTQSPKMDSLRREDSLRKERAARADVYVSGNKSITPEPTPAGKATATKSPIQRKKKACRKHRH
jgi:hypothetical protein